MTQWFKGIDFSNRQKILGVCYLEVSGQTLIAHFDQKDVQIERTGIDCPFGTSLGFSRLVHSQDPQYLSDDDYKTRHTERWLRAHLWSYETNTHWRSHVANDPQFYINQIAHVQPTLGLQIVPGFLNWIREQVGDTQFGDAIKAARRGENAFVEAHPRPFLYSAVERIWRNTLPPISDDILRAIVQYKDKPKVSHVVQRQTTYKFLQLHAAAWLGQGYVLADLTEMMTVTDHAFDAWLSAVTAFAHAQKMVITWQAAGIDEEEVNVEGHILILSQAVPGTAAKSGQGAKP